MTDDSTYIIAKASDGSERLSDKEILHLLSISPTEDEFYDLISASNRYSRKRFKNRGYVFVQIGINAEPCSGNCLFCSMGAGHYSLNEIWRKKKEDIINELEDIDRESIDDLFLMTTADYPMESYLDTVQAAGEYLSEGIRIVANTRDFNYKEAMLLKESGITGAYHVNRLREGIDTDLDKSQRLETLDAIKESGLELYYCIEPIGAEHTYEEILSEIRRAERLKPDVMAVMRRVNYPGSPLKDRKTITAIELVKIAAVTNLVVRPSRAMNLHEVEQMSLLAGVNQLYAEIGANPRDDKSRTENSRGLSISQTRKMLQDACYKLRG